MKFKSFLKKIVIVLLCNFIFILQCNESEFITMNFSTNLYPVTPMKNVQSLTMKLWGYVDGACNHEEVYEKFMNDQELFADQVVILHSMIDVLLLSLEAQVHECPSCVDQAIEDFDHIFGGLKGIFNNYNFLMRDQDDIQYKIIVEYLMNFMIKKIKKVLETGQISAPFFAFSKLNHSKLRTPLSPPANSVPVAPMA